MNFNRLWIIFFLILGSIEVQANLESNGYDYCYHRVFNTRIVRCIGSRKQIPLWEEFLVNDSIEWPNLDPFLFFDSPDWPSHTNLVGNLEGRVSFIQSHRLYPDSNCPLSLIPDREALLTFHPRNFYNSPLYQIKIYHDQKYWGKANMISPGLLLEQHSLPSVFSSSESKMFHDWSVPIPREAMYPGLSIEICDLEGNCGLISDENIVFSNYSEENIVGMRIGMLSFNKDPFFWVDHPEEAFQYYQSLPVSLLRISSYQDIYLSQVLLIDKRGAQVYTSSSPSFGDQYSGDMLQQVAQNQLGVGVIFANSGQIQSAWSDTTPLLLDPHWSILQSVKGAYTNKTVRHGKYTSFYLAVLSGEGVGWEFADQMRHLYGFSDFLEKGNYSLSYSPLAHQLHSYFPNDQVRQLSLSDSVFQESTSSFLLREPEVPIAYSYSEAAYLQKLLVSHASPKEGESVFTLIGFWNPEWTPEKEEVPAFLYPPFLSNYGYVSQYLPVDKTQDAWCELHLSYWNGDVQSIALSAEALGTSNPYNKFHLNISANKPLSQIYFQCVNQGKLLYYEEIPVSRFIEDFLNPPVVFGMDREYEDYLEDLLKKVDQKLSELYRLPYDRWILDGFLLNNLLLLGEKIYFLSSQSQEVLRAHRSRISSVQKLYDFLMQDHILGAIEAGDTEVYKKFSRLMKDLGWVFDLERSALYARDENLDNWSPYLNDNNQLEIRPHIYSFLPSWRFIWFKDVVGRIHSAYNPSLCWVLEEDGHIGIEECSIFSSRQIWKSGGPHIQWPYATDSFISLSAEKDSLVLSCCSDTSWRSLGSAWSPYWAYLTPEALSRLSMLHYIVYNRLNVLYDD